MAVVREGGMSRSASWICLVTITFVVVAGLCVVASMRFAVPPVYPPLPTPDYRLQAGIALTGAALAVVIGAVAVVAAVRAAARRARIVVTSAASVFVVGVAAAIAALTIP